MAWHCRAENSCQVGHEYMEQPPAAGRCLRNAAGLVLFPLGVKENNVGFPTVINAAPPHGTDASPSVSFSYTGI
ncbi:MAG: hypothetical protein AB2693_31435 [Candidatus Thiodiazotropha sp.]